ncbi:hypothetical protein Tsubulata_044942 [Turnera subulata]|uniref:Protein EXECUTER 1, chloroplastic n=1 Tax=Turnera subulata TaxID=218843 RepID=A0A9Q0J9P0_9ROSI|nr:hypothetical protein Tsubulata_044942 [Turnera subulata]
MASSISPPTPPPPHQLAFSSSSRANYLPKRPFCPPPFLPTRLSSSSFLRRCSNSADTPAPHWWWDAAIQDALKGGMRRFDSFMNSLRNAEAGAGNEAADAEEKERVGKKNKSKEEWDWDRWKKHFDEVEEQERLVSVLKSQLGNAVRREDYAFAARLKVAIAAAASNDTVGRVMSRLNSALAEEQYWDAASLRDNAGAGLVGWWSGISDDVQNPYGLIIRITPEHGRYVARSYSPRTTLSLFPPHPLPPRNLCYLQCFADVKELWGQLATAATGAPLFEIFLVMNKKGEYKQQPVYLERKEVLQDRSTLSSKALGATTHLNPLGPTEDKGDLLVSTEETEDGEDTEDGSDLAEGLPPVFQNVFHDMIPRMGTVDLDFEFELIDEEDEEDEEKDIELENAETDECKGESDEEKDDVELDVTIDDEWGRRIPVNLAIGHPQKFSGSERMKDSVRVPAKGFVRVPAKLGRKGHSSFSFSIEKDASQKDAKGPASVDKAKLGDQRSAASIKHEIANLIVREKIPEKVLKDISELINLAFNQLQSRESLSGLTTFHRIERFASSDPLDGLYVGSHYTSEVIQLQHKYGQWQDGIGNKDVSSLEFYEYVEAVKLTGDPYVPAGEVAFRAKVGKRYQLPHKGIIPEEFGVVGRYKGQGRLADAGFTNPRWVDGEFVILDGKYIKKGPIIAFIYWAPEYHFLVFFNRLRLQ